MKYLALVLGLFMSTGAQAAESYGLWDKLVDGYSITAGVHWQNEFTVQCRGREIEVDTAEPFFIGAEVRLPLTHWADLGVNFDRDFVDAPHWGSRVYVAIHPWAGY